MVQSLERLAALRAEPWTGHLLLVPHELFVAGQRCARPRAHGCALPEPWPQATDSCLNEDVASAAATCPDGSPAGASWARPR